MDSQQEPTREAARGTRARSLPIGAALARLWRRHRWRSQYVTDDIRNERVLYVESIFQAVADAGVFTFWGVFLVRLGAPQLLIGLFTSLPALGSMAAALPAGSFVQRRSNLVATANWARIGYRTVTAMFALLPFLPIGLAPYVMVGARTLLSIPSSVVDVAITTVWGQAVRPERRPRMLSTRWAINGLFAAGLGYLAGQWLDYASYPFNYQVLFISGLFAGVGSAIVLSRLKLRPVAQGAIKPRLAPRDLIPLLKREPTFLRFIIAASLYRLGMYLPMALYTIYRVRVLGCSDAWIGTLLTVQRLISVCSYFVSGRISTKPRVRRWLWISCVGLAFYPFSVAFSNTPQALLASSFVGGIFSPGANVFMTNKLFEVSPEAERPAFVAANSLVANAMAFVAPMLGTALSEATTIYVALFVGAALRALGGLSFRFLGVGGKREGKAA